MSEERIDLFTRAEVNAAKKIMRDTATPNERIYEEVVTEEVMQRIRRETGQDNHRGYMAYRLEHIASQN